MMAGDDLLLVEKTAARGFVSITQPRWSVCREARTTLELLY